MNRRNFIKTAIAAGVIAATPFKWLIDKITHRLYGDGIHDDSAAMQALLDGEDVIGPNGRFCERTIDPETGVETIHIQHGTYRV